MAWTRSDSQSALNTIFAETGSPALRRLLSELINGRNLVPFGLDATYDEINRAADVSARGIDGSSDLTITQALHDGKIILLGGSGAAKTMSLPAASGSYMRVGFLVTVVNTSNHVINAAGNSGAFYGPIFQVDKDSTAATAYHAAGGTGADVITLNGTTTGGLVGDFIEVTDIATNKWAVRGFCGVPAGSNIATPFS